MAQETWHAKQKGEIEADGSWRLEFPYADHRELIMDILKYGPDCEVVAPEDLRAHFRYPEDLFGIQTRVFTTYHMSEPELVYSREDQWEVPQLTRAQKRYRAWLAADCGLRFGEWLRSLSASTTSTEAA